MATLDDCYAALCDNDDELFIRIVTHDHIAVRLDSDGYTLLHECTSSRTVKHLLDMGANENTTSTFGETPLMQALYNRRDDVCTVLLEHGVDVTPSELRIPFVNDRVDMTRLLLTYGAAWPREFRRKKWFDNMIKSRDVCVASVVAWLGIYSKRRGTLMHCYLGRDISRIIAKLVFSTRFNTEPKILTNQ